MGPFTLTNEYLVFQVFDVVSGTAIKNKTLTIFEEGTAAADQTRLETPNFVPPLLLGAVMVVD